MRPKAVLLIYGEGGHRAQMKRLYARLEIGLGARGLVAVGICENADTLDGFESYSQGGVRDKHSRLRTLVSMPLALVQSVSILMRLVIHYKIVGVISTGPGIAIVPSAVLKLMGAKIIFLESWSRFETQSMTGKIMAKLAHRFYIQNRSLQKFYPSARFGGRL